MQQNRPFPTRWHSQPNLFDRYTGLPDPLQLGLLGEAICDAGEKIKAPYATTLLTALIAASTVTQPLCNVERPAGGITSLSLFGLLIADSGERKSSLINYFFKPIRNADIAAEQEYQRQLRQWERDIHIWEIHQKELQKKLSKTIEQNINQILAEGPTDE